MSANGAWPIARLGDYTSIKARIGWKGLQASEYREDGYIFLATPNIKGPHIDFRNVNFISERRYIESPELMLEVRDVLLVKDGSTLGISNLVRTLPGPATVNGSIAVLRCSNKLEPAFLHQLTKARAFQKLISDKKSGLGVPHLFQADLREFEIPLPRVCEQRRIAEILDNLDIAIHETEAIITKLNAVKQGLLYDLLTQGLDTNGELRPAQLEAPHLYKESRLGWVPKEWEVASLSTRIASLDAGVSVNSEDRPHSAGEIGVLKTSALSRGEFRPEQNKTVVAAEVRLVREAVAGDSILVSRMNTPELVGESCYVAEPWPSLFLPDRVWQLKKKSADSVDMRWLSFVLQTSQCRRYVKVHATGTSGSMKNLPKSQLMAMPVAFPAVGEQKAIAVRINAVDARIVSEITNLGKLKAQKSGLMDDLFSGRVRVTPQFADKRQEGNA